MSDQGRVCWLGTSRWARKAPPPEPPPGIATPTGSPFADYSSSWSPTPAPVGSATTSLPLARTVQVLAWCWALTNIVAGALALRARLSFEDWFDAKTDVDEWYDAHDLMNTAVILSSLVGLALFVVLLVWCYQVTRSTSRHHLRDRRWTTGWAVGGWFIPVANLIIPWLVIRENDRIAEAAGDGRPTMWVHARPRWTTNAWWLFAVAGFVLASLGAASIGLDEALQSDFSETRRGYVFVAIGRSLVALAGVLLAFVVGRISRADHSARGERPRGGYLAQPDASVRRDAE